MNLKSFGIIIIVFEMPHSLCEHVLENHNISISTTFWKYIAWSYRVLAQTCGPSKSITKFNFFLIALSNIDSFPYNNWHGLYHARYVYLSIKLISKGETILVKPTFHGLNNHLTRPSISRCYRKAVQWSIKTQTQSFPKAPRNSQPWSIKTFTWTPNLTKTQSKKDIIASSNQFCGGHKLNPLAKMFHSHKNTFGTSWYSC